MPRLETAMSEPKITPEMRLQAISDLKHSLVKRDICTALSRADYALFLDKKNKDMKRLYEMVQKMDKLIMESYWYKQLMLQCHRTLKNGN